MGGAESSTVTETKFFEWAEDFTKEIVPDSRTDVINLADQPGFYLQHKSTQLYLTGTFARKNYPCPAVGDEGHRLVVTIEKRSVGPSTLSHLDLIRIKRFGYKTYPFLARSAEGGGYFEEGDESNISYQTWQIYKKGAVYNRNNEMNAEEMKRQKLVHYGDEILLISCQSLSANTAEPFKCIAADLDYENWKTDVGTIPNKFKYVGVQSACTSADFPDYFPKSVWKIIPAERVKTSVVARNVLLLCEKLEGKVTIESEFEYRVKEIIQQFLQIRTTVSHETSSTVGYNKQILGDSVNSQFENRFKFQFDNEYRLTVEKESERKTREVRTVTYDAERDEMWANFLRCNVVKYEIDGAVVAYGMVPVSYSASLSRFRKDYNDPAFPKTFYELSNCATGVANLPPCPVDDFGFLKYEQQ